MAYSNEIMRKADSIMEDRRSKANHIADENRKIAYDKSPKIREIEESLSTIGAKTGRAVLSGGNTTETLMQFKSLSLQLQQELIKELNQIGMQQDSLEPNFLCKKCNDTGFYEDNGKTLICDCLKKLRTNIAIDELNSNSPLNLCTFESFDLSKYSMDLGDYHVSPYSRMSNIFKYCKNYAEKFTTNNPSLLMKGATGLGKTHLSLAIARAVIEKGYSVVYVSAPMILSTLEKQHFSHKYEEEEQTLNILTQCDLLIIDDIGTEFNSLYNTSSLYNLFNTRLLKSLPIIFSTNLTLNELKDDYSDRFVSRVLGCCTKLDFIGKDLRMPNIN